MLMVIVAHFVSRMLLISFRLRYSWAHHYGLSLHVSFVIARLSPLYVLVPTDCIFFDAQYFYPGNWLLGALNQCVGCN